MLMLSSLVPFGGVTGVLPLLKPWRSSPRGQAVRCYQFVLLRVERTYRRHGKEREVWSFGT